MTIGKRAMADADEVGAAAYDYLFYSGYMALAYWWARCVAAAEASSQSQAFKDATRETARFYFTRILPRTLEHKAAIESSAAPLMAMDADCVDSYIGSTTRIVLQIGVASGVGGVTRAHGP